MTDPPDESDAAALDGSTASSWLHQSVRPRDADDGHPHVERYTLDLTGNLRDGAPYLQGGMGRVYRAANSEGKIVAVKLPRPDTSAALSALWEREYSDAARLSNHEHVVTIHDLSWATWPDGRRDRALVMEWLPNALPMDRFAERHALDKSQRVNLVAQACSGISHVHAHHRLHCDIKPGNLLVIATERGPCVKVTDFGAVRRSNALDCADVVSTPGYRSPEQGARAIAQIDERTDVFGLGRVLLGVVCGDAAVRAAQTSDVPPRDASARWLGRADQALDELIVRSTSIDPADRFASVRAFREALDGYRAPRAERAILPIARFFWPWHAPLHRHRGAVRRMIAVLVLAALALFIADRANVAMHTHGIGPSFWMPAPTVATFRDVAIIRIRPDTDLARVGAEFGIDGLDRENPGSIRRLWRRVTERLVDCKPAAIGYDAQFKHRGDALDTEVHAMCTLASARGVPVTLGILTCATPGDGDLVDGVLRVGGVHAGSILVAPLEGLGPSIVAVQTDRTAIARFPFAMHVAAAVISQPHRHQLELDVEHGVVRVQVDGGGRGRELSMTAIEPINASHVQHIAGVREDERAGWYTFVVPEDDAFAEIDLSVDDFLRRDPGQLASLLGGRAVLIGNNLGNPDADGGAQDMTDVTGHYIPGVWLHASAVQALVDAIKPPLVDGRTTLVQITVATLGIALGWLGACALLRSRRHPPYADRVAGVDASPSFAAMVATTCALCAFAVVIALGAAHVTALRIEWRAGLVLGAGAVGAMIGLWLALGARWAAVLRRASCAG